MQQRNMTIGNPIKSIVKFAIPVFIGNIFHQFHSMMDTVIVGKFISAKALATIGSVSTINYLIIGFMLGLISGFTVLTAQRYGAKDMKNVRKTVGSSIILSILFTSFVSLFTISIMNILLKLMHTPKDIFNDSYEYITIVCFGLFSTVFYNLLGNILRALGNSQVPLFFFILAASLNVIFDLFFIGILNFQVVGVAYAKIVSNGIAGVLCLLYIIISVPELRLKINDFYLSIGMVKKQVCLAIPIAIQCSFTAIGTMVVQFALNILGSASVAAFTAAIKIEQFISQVCLSLGTTMATYCAQNIGAKKTRRIRSGLRIAFYIGIIYSIIFGNLMCFYGKHFTRFFVISNSNILKGQIDVHLKCAALFLIIMNIMYIYRNAMQGMGYGFLPMLGGLTELSGRSIMAIIAINNVSYFSTCLAGPFAWSISSILLLAMYNFIAKKQKNI